MTTDGQTNPDQTDAVRSYCVRCKCVRLIARALTIILPSGKPAVKGVCPVCGIKLMRSWRAGM